jgi:hypothetical protein
MRRLIGDLPRARSGRKSDRNHVAPRWRRCGPRQRRARRTCGDGRAVQRARGLTRDFRLRPAFKQAAHARVRRSRVDAHHRRQRSRALAQDVAVRNATETRAMRQILTIDFNQIRIGWHLHGSGNSPVSREKTCGLRRPRPSSIRSAILWAAACSRGARLHPIYDISSIDSKVAISFG